ncbi:MAG: hypothetical protein JEZ03_15260, partial [Bacteroidales bacterium]|nr:hypothetical protein [Bacteroidales bacterium]
MTLNEMKIILFYVGMVQGIILSLLLFSSKNNKPANRILGIMTFSWAILCLVMAVNPNALSANHPNIYLLHYTFLFINYPPLYLYTKYLTVRKSYHRIDLLHFAPAILFLIAFILYLIFSTIFQINQKERFIYVWEIVSRAIWSFQGIIYPVLALIILGKYRKSVLNHYSNTEHITLHWLRRL